MRCADSRGWSLRRAEPPVIGGALPIARASVAAACGCDEAAVQACRLGTWAGKVSVTPVDMRGRFLP